MPQQTQLQSPTATPFCMPMRNEHVAPTFDSSKPRKLPQFFEDLETLRTCANITNHTEMKKQVVKYVNIDTEQMWKTFPEYVLAAHSYEEFKDAILD